MGDLFDQASILAVIFESSYNFDPTKLPMSYFVLRSEEHFKSMDDVGTLGPMLTYLLRTGYIEGDNYRIQLTGKGMNTTIWLFRKFLIFIRRYYPDKLSSWINILDLRKGNNRELIRDSYFYIKREPPLREAFKHYLDEIDTIENVETFEVDVYDLNMLIEDIFLNLADINRLFEHRFKCKLFLPPIPAQTILNRATRGKEVKFTDFVATLGSVLGGIYDKEIDKLLESTTLESGPINKIKSFLDKENIIYDPKTIEILRAIYRLRSTTFPIHETGSEIIPSLQKLNISYPIGDYKSAATKILQNLNSCLLDMKLWFQDS
jgi:hypothetical protein